MSTVAKAFACRSRTVVLALLVLVAVSGVASNGRAGASSALRLRHNIAPNPNYIVACVDGGPMSRKCVSQTVRAINAARALEGTRKLRLPRNYRRLTVAEQVFVVIDLERVDRGIRPIEGMVASMNRSATLFAQLEIDPHPVTFLLQSLGVHRYRSLYARDYGALAADYEWMYDDGYSPTGRTNIVCPYRGAPGCWSHRTAILDRFNGLPLLMAGTGGAKGAGGTNTVTAIMTGGYGSAPRFTYRWSQALAHGADRHGR